MHPLLDGAFVAFREVGWRRHLTECKVHELLELRLSALLELFWCVPWKIIIGISAVNSRSSFFLDRNTTQTVRKVGGKLVYVTSCIS
jgi:hypothetical protein